MEIGKKFIGAKVPYLGLFYYIVDVSEEGYSIFPIGTDDEKLLQIKVIPFSHVDFEKIFGGDLKGFDKKQLELLESIRKLFQIKKATLDLGLAFQIIERAKFT